MIVLLVAGTASLAALILFWAWRHWGSTVAGVSAVLAGLLAMAASAFYLWALGSTDSSQLARAVLWGESSYYDSEVFPARSFPASNNPVFLHPPDQQIALPSVDGVADVEEALEQSGTTALLVVHDGSLVYEQYFNGASRDTLQTSFSVAKSWTATLVGAALDDGLISSLDDPITMYLPELLARDERFSLVTLRHLITMSSGIDFVEGSSPWDDPANTYYGTDIRAASLTNTTIREDPGRTFHYNDWNLILMGQILERVTGTSVSEYLWSRLWQPMGAENPGSWSLDSESSGFEKMFVGLNSTAVDTMKLGLLYLNDGSADGRPVVSPEFIREAVSADASNGSTGYQFWWWLDEPRSSFFANGDHCQFVYVNPTTNVVLVRHGERCDGHNWVDILGELSVALQP